MLYNMPFLPKTCFITYSKISFQLYYGLNLYIQLKQTKMNEINVESFDYYELIRKDEKSEFPAKGIITGSRPMGSCRCGDVCFKIEWSDGHVKFKNSNWPNSPSGLHIPYVGNVDEILKTNFINIPKLSFDGYKFYTQILMWLQESQLNAI